MNFTKTEAQGNDFIFVQTGDRKVIDSGGPTAVRLCDRRTGIGADGLIFLSPSDKTAARMTIWNSDGSRAAVCGNALRCTALFGLTCVETDTGLHELSLESADQTVSVCLGIPGVGLTLSLTVKNRQLPVQAINMGNPHAVIWADLSGPPEPDFALWAGLVENHEAFPDRTNVEWVVPEGGGVFRVRVWERGAGLTNACGSGACAVHAAAALRGLTGRTSRIIMPGGELVVEEDAGGRLWLGGTVREVFQGTVNL